MERRGARQARGALSLSKSASDALGGVHPSASSGCPEPVEGQGNPAVASNEDRGVRHGRCPSGPERAQNGQKRSGSAYFGPAGAGSTMLRLSTEQRRLLADKLGDAANIAAGAMIFGQFLGDRRISLAAAALGFAIWLGLTAWALSLERGSDPWKPTSSCSEASSSLPRSSASSTSSVVDATAPRATSERSEPT